MSFTLILIGLPLALTLLVPWRWLPPYVLTITGCGVLIWADEARQCATCGGAGDAVGIAIVMLLFYGFAAGICLRLLHAAVRPTKQRAWFEMSLLSASTTWAMLAVAGAGLTLTLLVDATRTAFGSGLVTHGALVLLAGGWYFLFSRSWMHAPAVVKYVGVVAIVAAMGWSLSVPHKVVDAAIVAANGEPYCIQASGPDGLRPVRSKWDLTGFMLRAGGMSARHANLAVGQNLSPKWLHWSYRNGAFEGDFMGGVLHCDLRSADKQAPGWLHALPTAASDGPFWLAGGQWRIPAAYRGGASDRPASLYFFAEGSNFDPMSAQLAEKGRRSLEVFNARVQVMLCTREQLHVWHVVRNDVNFQIEPMGHEQGLEKQLVRFRGWSGPRVQFVGRDAAGDPTTWIQCEGGECRHAFRRDGIAMEFMHPAGGFAAWRALQDSAWRRLQSFALAWPQGAAKSCSDN